MEACAPRRAVFSFARIDGLCPGQTGVLFTPSLISDDQYRLSVYFAYGDKGEWDQAEPVDQTFTSVDQAPEAAHLVPYLVPRARTESMTVARVVTVARHWVPKATLSELGFTWQGVVKEFERSGIYFNTATAEKPKVLDRTTFVNLLAAEIGRQRVRVQLMFAPRQEQFAHGYAVKLRTRTELFPEATRFYQQRLTTHQAHGPQRALAAFVYSHCELSDPDAVAGLQYLPWADRDQLLEVLKMTMPRVVDAGLNVKSDADAGRKLVDLAWEDASEYLEACRHVSRDMLMTVCGLIKQQHAPDEPGLHYFQFDYESNLETYSASGWGFATPSNLTACPECGAQLSGPERAQRQCGTCASPLHDDGTLMTLVPLSLVRPVGVLDLATNISGIVALVRNAQDPANETLAQRLTLQSMPGVRAEVLVAHEMGHELFLPHATTGFDRKDISPDKASFAQGKVLAEFVKALDSSPALLKKVKEATAPSGGSHDLHASDYSGCMMGYNFAALSQMHFCFKCLLRMRGWPKRAIESLR